MEPAPVNDGFFGPNSRITSPAWRLWLNKLVANVGNVSSNVANITPSNTVANETSFGLSPSAGAGTSYSLGNHTHGTPANPVTAHVAASDPHTQYQLESEKAAANGYASLNANGYVPANQLGGGTANANVYLSGNNTWTVPPNPPAGSDTYVQFNDGGILGGDEHFIWNKTSDYLQIGASGYRTKIQRGVITAVGQGTTNGSIVLYSESGSGTVGSFLSCKTSAGVNVFAVNASGKVRIYPGAALPNLYDFEMNNYAYIGTGIITSAVCARTDSSTALKIMRANKSTAVINFDFSAADAQIDILDTTNISIGTGTGTKLGTAANQKIGFWGATPVVQSTGWSVTAGYTPLKTFNPAAVTLTELARFVATWADTHLTNGQLGA